MFLYDLVRKLEGMGPSTVKLTGDHTYGVSSPEEGNALFPFSFFGEDMFAGVTGLLSGSGTYDPKTMAQTYLQRILANRAMKVNNQFSEGATLQQGATAVTKNGDTIQQFNNNTSVTTKSDGTKIQTDADGVMSLTLPSGKSVKLDKMTTTITSKNGATTSIWGDPHVTNPDGTRQELDKIGDYTVDLGEGATMVLHANYMGNNDPSTTVISSADIKLKDGTIIHHDITNASQITNPDGTITKTEVDSSIQEQVNTVRDTQVSVSTFRESGSTWEREIERTNTLVSEKDKKLMENTRSSTPVVKTTTTTAGGSTLTTQAGNVVTNTDKADSIYEFIASGVGYAPRVNNNLDVFGGDAGYKPTRTEFLQIAPSGLFGDFSNSDPADVLPGLIGPTQGSFWNFNSFISIGSKDNDPTKDDDAIAFNYARTQVTEDFEREWDRQTGTVSDRVLWERTWRRD